MFKSANEVLRMSDRISKIVRGLMEFSQGGELGVVETVHALEIAESLSTVVSPMTKSKDIELEFIFADEMVRVLEFNCRPIEIKQILVNLISNAMDAYGKNETDKKIEVIIAHEGEWVTFTVVDHGCGIPSEIQKRIFEPFVSTKNETKGNGLGLSVSQGLAQSNGGRLSFVSVESDDHSVRGTKFKLALPVNRMSQKSA
jgi:C4-dicarboxylate-specific signal transduction histidine kinase